MRIGFDAYIFSSDAKSTAPEPNAYKPFSAVFSELVSMGNELFILYAAELNAKKAVSFKKKAIRTAHKQGLTQFRFAVIPKDDLAGAVKRNHIDIFITNDVMLADEISAFTDCVCPAGNSAEDMLAGIIELIRKNRLPVIPEDSSPHGLPSEDKLWLKYYRSGDLKWNSEKMSPYDRLIISNKDWLDETAMEFFGKRFTYSELFKRIDSVADIMYVDGIKKGVTVPVIFANTPESIIILYALYKLKATVAPIFPLSTKEDIICHENIYRTHMVICPTWCSSV